MDPGSAFYDHLRRGEAPSDVIVVCRSRIHDQMAVSVAVTVNCALRLRTFPQVKNFCTKVLNLRAKPKFLMHIRPFIIFILFIFFIIDPDAPLTKVKPF